MVVVGIIVSSEVLASGIRGEPIVSSGTMVIGVVILARRAIDVVRGPSIATMVPLPPSTVVAFVAQSHTRVNVAPERGGRVGLPTFDSSESQGGRGVAKVAWSLSFIALSLLTLRGPNNTARSMIVALKRLRLVVSFVLRFTAVLAVVTIAHVPLELINLFIRTS